MERAKSIMMNIDNDDVPFIAAALVIHANIWSDDKHFLQQNEIKVWTTKDLMKMMNL